ncbi:MAG TPA: hypothetical protein VGJ53_09740 [Micromonosporaceae bacterium]|jgi:hypothetical protein
MATRRFSITLPEDVAAHLDTVENASAYIAEAIRLRMRRQRTREMLAAHGFTVTDEGVARMRERVRALEARRAKRGRAA